MQDLMLEKFSLKEPSCELYDEKMHFYSMVEADIVAQPKDKQVKFILLHMGSLAKSLQNSSRSWVMSLGKFLNIAACDSLVKLDEELDVCITVIGHHYCQYIMFHIYLCTRRSYLSALPYHQIA